MQPFPSLDTAQKMKFSIKGFFSKCDQIHNFLMIWSHLLKKSIMENFIFCAVKISYFLVSLPITLLLQVPQLQISPNLVKSLFHSATLLSIRFNRLISFSFCISLYSSHQLTPISLQLQTNMCTPANSPPIFTYHPL